jgi:myo-inositol-1(or 4)-monophosphatase
MLSNLAWDVSAGVVLVREAGGLVYDSDGSDHTPHSLHTVASAPGLSRALARVVQEVTGR